jgi:hypothetical protein
LAHSFTPGYDSIQLTITDAGLLTTSILGTSTILKTKFVDVGFSGFLPVSGCGKSDAVLAVTIKPLVSEARLLSHNVTLIALDLSLAINGDRRAGPGVPG